MSAQVPQSVVSAYTAENLVEVVEANEFGPDITEDMADRLIDMARRRTQARCDSTVNVGEKDFLVFTDWDSFCRDTFGSSTLDGDSIPNRFALAVPNFQVSIGRDAWLCKDAVAVQQNWLETGDGRCNQLEEVDQTNTQFHDDVREFWSPKDYTALVGFGDELLYEEPKAADAM